MQTWDGTPVDEAPPADSSGLNSLAWRIVSHGTRGRAEYACARELALQACDLASGRAGIWNTLGAAEYRVGNYAAVIAALKKSIELRKTPSLEDAFFLAMANAKLGLKDEARRCFDAGVKAIEKGANNMEQLIRFRAEAALLLGTRDGGK